MPAAAAAATLVALELDHVTIRREGRVVVEDTSLTVEAGSIHVVIGPNGAGKSTLLGAVLGQVAFAGTIRMHFRTGGRVGYVPQSFVADRTLPITVMEFLAMSRQRWPVCLGVRSHARAQGLAILERLGLPHLAARRLGELSGGELRRVLLGNAIDPAPELLLCDEPSTGLDPEAVEAFDRMLCALRDDHGTAVLMVSHDRAEVRRVADRVTRLHVTVKASGTAAEVLDGAASPLEGAAE